MPDDDNQTRLRAWDLALERLAETDAKIAAAPGGPRSLCPERPQATSLEQLAVSLLGRDSAAVRVTGFARTLAGVVESLLENFPDNIFWDFDYFSVCLLDQLSHADDPSQQHALEQRYVALHRRFGIHSPIRFRYGHDFYYGYDWARWVRREPNTRREVGPFEAPFVDVLFTRGAEILELTSNDDARYPSLPSGQMRNTQPFSRDPEHEERLLSDLAERGELPLEAWRLDAKPRYQEPFADLRQSRAVELGIPSA